LKKNSIVIDIDGTVCPLKSKDEDYAELIPSRAIVDRISEYKNNGFSIILFTSRNMNTHNGEIGIINKHTLRPLIEWLEKWDIYYDEIIMGKPWPGELGFYVDDRTVRPKEFLDMSIEELNQLMRQDRTK
jgi:capsule biosynthesis phosphatase